MAEKVELIITADSKQAVQGIRETQKAAEDLNKVVVDSQKEQEKAIKETEKALAELAKSRDKANDPRKIADFNKKIQEAKYELEQLRNAQVKTESTSQSLLSTMSKWALSLGGAAAALKILKEAVLATTAGINAFNIAGAVTKQVLYNLVTGAGSLTAGLNNVIKAQKELNELRLKEVADTFKAKQQQVFYNKYYFEASDRRKTDKERIELLNKAMEAHNKMIEIQKENILEQLDANKKLLEAAPGNEKLLMQYGELSNKLLDLESARYSGVKRIETTLTSLQQDEIEKREKLFKDYYNYLDSLNEEADRKQRQRDEEDKQALDQLYLYYRNQFFDYLDDVEKAREKEKEAEWDFNSEIGRKLFKQNQELAKEQAKAAGLLGIDPESPEGKDMLDDLKSAANRILGIYADFTDGLVDDTRRRRELYDEQIAETQRSLDLEAELMEEGFANNVDLKRKEIEELKKLRAEALKKEEEALRKQRIVESIVQGVNLATSVTQLLKEYTKIPIVGIALAGAAIAALFALFASAKSKAASAVKLAEGGTGTDTGMITGKSHAEGGEHFLSHVEVERGERWGVLNRRASDKFGKTFDNIVSSFNKNEMPDFIGAEPVNNIRVDNDGPNSRLDKVIAEQRKLNDKFGKREQMIIAGNKKIITRGNKVRIVG